MSKKEPKTSVDFDIGIGEIIPSTQEAFKDDGFHKATRKEEKTGIIAFKQNFLKRLEDDLKDKHQFPTANEVFIFVVQYFVSETEYRSRDIDNMAKTILDVLKERFYRDDGQVKTLLIGKKIEGRVSRNFAYIAIKELKGGRDVDALKISGLERSITLYQELRSKGIVS